MLIRIVIFNAVGSRIQLCQIELQQAVSEAHSMEGELAVRNNKLFDVEVDVQFFNICEGIQQDASQSIRKLNTQLATELVNYRYLYVHAISKCQRCLDVLHIKF